MQVFSNPAFGQIRTLTINDEPWFVGKDVATVLGYSNPRKAMIDHVDEEDKTDGVTICDSIGREQNPICINESGLYSLILSSKLPNAKKFKRWVTSEVLPAIRKTGTYGTRSNVIVRDLTTDDYKDAARWVSQCWKSKSALQIVLGFLEKGGYEIPKVMMELDEPSSFSEEQFGTRLLEAIQSRGMTRCEFAKKSGLPKSAISQYCSGKVKRPSRKNLILICTNLDVDVDYFY